MTTIGKKLAVTDYLRDLNDCGKLDSIRYNT